MPSNQAAWEARLRQCESALRTVRCDHESLVYAVTHDMGGPVRSIATWSQALEEDDLGRLSEEGVRYLHRVRADVSRLKRMIEAIAALHNLAQSPLQREAVDVSALAHQIADTRSSQEVDRSVDFSVQPGLMVQADRPLLTLALRELVDNAWKFTRKNPLARVEFGARSAGKPVVFHVKDNGAGFDMKFASRLFGMFQRMHREVDFPGLGMGLALARHVFERHGGRLWAEAAVAEGAAFYFTLETQSDRVLREKSS